ncbi:MAG: phage portal protein [Gemmatales bacterium]|nr:phage portal protein [Gemmatales bacterium]MDW7995380.1 phage portal protein [Gemmatales bacterium]
MPLDIRFVEADQVTMPDPWELTERLADGIVFDTFGNPVEYHVLQDHPSEAAQRSYADFDRIPAPAMLP